MRKFFVVLCIIGIMLFTGLAMGAPAIISPTPGTKLTDTTVTFSWNAAGYTYFRFYGGDNIAPYQSDTITETSITLTGFPDDGSPIFVRLSYWDGAEWQHLNYPYQSTGSGAVKPSISSPAPGSDISSATQTFQLDFGDYKVDTWMSFQLIIGSAPLTSDIFEGALVFEETVTVNNLPQDASSVYVTLRYWDGLVWKNVEYTYLSKKFPWALFLPAIQVQHECSLEYLGLCRDKQDCEEVGGYWWTQECHKNMSSSQALMAKLAGNVHFTYYMYGVQWNEYYNFDINTLTEMNHSGWFEIYGVDAYGNRVRVYDHGINLFGGKKYIFNNYGFPSLDERFIFEWVSANRLTGTIEVKTKDQYWGSGTKSYLTGYYTP